MKHLAYVITLLSGFVIVGGAFAQDALLSQAQKIGKLDNRTAHSPI